MPEIVGAVAGAAVTTAVSAVAGPVIGQLVGGVVSAAVVGALSPKSSSRAEALVINETGSLSPINIVAGSARITPNRVFISSSDNNNPVAGAEEYLHAVYTIAGNPLITMGSIYFDGVVIGEFNGPFSNADFDEGRARVSVLPRNDIGGIGTTGGQFNKFVLDSEYKNFIETEYGVVLDDDDIHVIAYAGRPVQVANDDMTANVPDVNEDFRGAGFSGEHDNAISYIYIRLRYNPKLYNDIPLLQVDTLGGSSLDIFTNDLGESMSDLLPVLTGMVDEADNERNGAVQLATYLAAKTGGNLSLENLDFDSFLSTAVTLYNNNIFSDGVIDANTTIFDNVSRLLANNLCALIQSNGIYKMKYIAPEADIFDVNTFEFDESNIIGSWNVNLGDKTKSYDIGRVTFFNDELDYQADSVTVFAPGVDPTLNNLNGADAILELDLPFTNNKTDAIYIGSVIMAMTKFDLQVSFKTTLEALQLEPLDPVYVSHPVAGWDKKKFLVNEITINPDSTCDVVLTEYADIYPLTLATELSTYDNIPTTELIVTEIGQGTIGLNTAVFATNQTFSATQYDRFVLVAHGFSDDATGFTVKSITVDGVLATIDVNYLEEGDRVVNTAIASISGLEFGSASKQIVVTYDGIMTGAAVGLYKITGGHDLYPVENKSAQRCEYAGATDSYTTTVNEIPSQGVMIWGNTKFNGSIGVSVTSPDFTLTEAYDLQVGTISRCSSGFKNIDSTTYAYSDVTITIGVVETNVYNGAIAVYR